MRMSEIAGERYNEPGDLEKEGRGLGADQGHEESKTYSPKKKNKKETKIYRLRNRSATTKGNQSSILSKREKYRPFLTERSCSAPQSATDRGGKNNHTVTRNGQPARKRIEFQET